MIPSPRNCSDACKTNPACFQNLNRGRAIDRCAIPKLTIIVIPPRPDGAGGYDVVDSCPLGIQRGVRGDDGGEDEGHCESAIRVPSGKGVAGFGRDSLNREK